LSQLPTVRVGNIRHYDGSIDPAQVIRIDRSSIWGNPFKAGWAVDSDGSMRYNPKELVLARYNTLMLQRVTGQPGPKIQKADENGRRNYGVGTPPTPEERDAEAMLWIQRLESLAGKLLLCWCAPEPCHGDILATMCQSTRKYRTDLKERTAIREYKRSFRT
jgi:hypothetical protein